MYPNITKVNHMVEILEKSCHLTSTCTIHKALGVIYSPIMVLQSNIHFFVTLDCHSVDYCRAGSAQ